jgi:hypothetical protein
MGDDLGDEYYELPRHSEDESSDAEDGAAESSRKRPHDDDGHDADDMADEAAAALAAAKKNQKKKKKKKPHSELTPVVVGVGASADALAAAFMSLYLKEVRDLHSIGCSLNMSQVKCFFV